MQRVSRLVSRANQFDAAVERVAEVLEKSDGTRVVSAQPHAPGQNDAGRLAREQAASQLLGEKLVQSRSYSTSLRDGGREVGRIVILFPAEIGESQIRLARFLGEQLGMLLVRTRLFEKNLAARRSLESMREEITSRKLVPRAIALLYTRYRMKRREAESWLASQSRTTGLSTVEIAERLVAGHADAAGLVGPARRQHVRLSA